MKLATKDTGTLWSICYSMVQTPTYQPVMEQGLTSEYCVMQEFTFRICSLLLRPIHDAVEAGNFEIVTVLVDHGADPMVEYSERTPLEIAKSCNFQEIIDYLTGLLQIFASFFFFF